MVALPWHPVLFALTLDGDVDKMVIHHLQTLKRHGFRTIGIEPTFHLDMESFKLLGAVSRESKTNESTREQLRKIRIALLQSTNHPTYALIKQWAEKMGFHVQELGSKPFGRALKREVWRYTRDQIQAGMKLSLNDGAKLREEIATLATRAHKTYPHGHLLLSTHARVLTREAEKMRPDVILVSSIHAPYIARKVGIPTKDITWVATGYVINRPTGTERGWILPLMKGLRKYERTRRRIESERKKQRTERRRRPPG